MLTSRVNPAPPPRPKHPQKWGLPRPAAAAGVVKRRQKGGFEDEGAAARQA